jgi:hypothetical protein
MTVDDVELMRLFYLVGALGVVLFSSMLTRWLWRPLRFLFLAAVISLMFTPYSLDQAMPNGETRNIVPAFVVAINDVANDRANWKQGIKRGGKAILTVGSVLGTISLLLAIFLPRPTQNPRAQSGKRTNPYLPDDLQNTTPTQETH